MKNFFVNVKCCDRKSGIIEEDEGAHSDGGRNTP
jgi:hypothetical protein